MQDDERVATAGHPDRNVTHLRERRLEHSPMRPVAYICHAGGVA